MVIPIWPGSVNTTASTPPRVLDGAAVAGRDAGDATGSGGGLRPETAADASGFAALVAAARPAQATPAAAQTAADARMAKASAALSAALQAEVDRFASQGGEADLTAMMAAFAGLLQGFDAATGSDTLDGLLAQMHLLDPAGLALIEARAADPAALFAALAAMAGVALPPGDGKTAGGGAVMAQVGPGKGTLVAGRGPEAGSAMPLRPHAPVPTPPWTAPDETPLAPTAVQAGGARAQAAPLADAALMPATGPGTTEGAADLRARLIAALSATASGAASTGEPSGAALSQADLRHQHAPAADMARPAALPPNPPASGFARNLTHQIRQASFSEGQTRIVLSPRGLGEIEIDMRPDEAGKLRIVLRAENPAVLQALRGDRDGLLLSLNSGGTDISDADLSFEGFGQHRRSAPDLADGFAGRAAEQRPTDDNDPVLPPSRPAADGTLDILT